MLTLATPGSHSASRGRGVEANRARGWRPQGPSQAVATLHPFRCNIQGADVTYRPFTFAWKGGIPRKKGGEHKRIYHDRDPSHLNRILGKSCKVKGLGLHPRSGKDTWLHCKGMGPYAHGRRGNQERRGPGDGSAGCSGALGK